MFNKRKPKPRKYEIHRTLSSGVSHSGDNLASRPEESPEPVKSSWFSWKKGLLLLLLVILIPFTVIAVWDFRNFSAASSKIFGNSNPIGVLATKPLDDTDKRVNILLIGYSADDPGHGGARLTDSLLILSLDKDSKTGFMLSIPRDLYVNIPGVGKRKINEAYQVGERDKFRESGYPPNGPGLLRKIISDNLKIDLQYHAIINYSATRDIVDALDGVDVTIDSPDKRGIYDPNFQPDEGGPLKLSNGKQHIDGQTALRLTRARGSTYGSYGFPQSDFNRTNNQQAVLSAIKNELDWTLVLDPRTNGKIFNAAAENINTDIELSEVLPMYRLFNSVPDDQLRRVNLSNFNKVNLLKGYRTPSGQSAQIPAAGIDDFSKIQRIIRSLEQ